jgi:hypothetical protein
VLVTFLFCLHQLRHRKSKDIETPDDAEVPMDTSDCLCAKLCAEKALHQEAMICPAGPAEERTQERRKISLETINAFLARDLSIIDHRSDQLKGRMNCRDPTDCRN